MRILVTRPLPDAETTAAELRRRGHEPLLAPMLETHFVDWASIAAPPLPHALVATSLNGIRGLMGHPEIVRLRELPLFVAGDSSARQAETLGFSDVRSAQGDMTAIVARIAREQSVATTLLYAASYDRSGDLAADLTSRGYKVDLVEVYRALSVKTLPDAIAAQLKDGKIDCILIFSSRTAEAFVASLRRANLLALCRIIPIHAISQQAAEPLLAADFRSVAIALRPDAAELLRTLESTRSPVSDMLPVQGDPHDSK